MMSLYLHMLSKHMLSMNTSMLLQVSISVRTISCHIHAPDKWVNVRGNEFCYFFMLLNGGWGGGGGGGGGGVSSYRRVCF